MISFPQNGFPRGVSLGTNDISVLGIVTLFGCLSVTLSVRVAYPFLTACCKFPTGTTYVDAPLGRQASTP